MRTVVFDYLIFFLGFSFWTFSEPLQVVVKGESVLLIDADTDAILFEKEAYTPHYPASTTKIATALYTLKFKQEALSDLITVEQEALATVSQEVKRQSHYALPAYWLEPDGKQIGLRRGEAFTLKQLLEGMLIYSGNDASNVIAQALGNTIPDFMNQVNAYLKEIGCRQTHFCNPHGLHHPQHQTTAYDLALMAKEALKIPIFREIVSSVRFTRPKTNKQKGAIFLQSNRLLRPGPFYYSKAIGIKTGYHAKAKHTLVGAARSEDRTLIAVLLGYQDRDQMFRDAIKLFDTAFNQPKIRRTFLKAGIQKFNLFLHQANQSLQTYLMEDLTLDYYPAEDPQPDCKLKWHVLTLPIKKDQNVGELYLFSKNGQLLKKTPILAWQDVQLKWPYNWMTAFREFVHQYPFLSWTTLIMLISLIMVSFWFLFK
jgi:D-alanyl-D-alanine carboxypeptidase (penicillin-binding protein 5/6)